VLYPTITIRQLKILVNEREEATLLAVSPTRIGQMPLLICKR